VRSSEHTATSLCRDADGPPKEVAAVCSEALSEFDQTAHGRAQVLVRLGQAKRRLGQFSAALDHLEEAVELAPQMAWAYRELAWVHWNQSRYDRAEAAFRTAFAIAPDEDSISGIASSIARGGGDQDAALEIFAQVYRIHPDAEWAMVEEGWLHFEKSRYSEAVAAFERALAINNRYFHAQLGRARSYYNWQKMEEALGAISSALAIREARSALVLRSKILRETERPARAVTDARRAMELYPKADTPPVALARALIDLGRSAEADAVYRAKAATIDSPYLRYWHADFLSDEERWQEAAEVLKPNLTHAGADKWDFNLMAYIALQTDDFDTVRTSAAQALALDPTFDAAAINMVYGYAMTGSYVETVDSFSRARELGMNAQDVQNLLAFLTRHEMHGLATLLRWRADLD
ncbi:MAG: tetratricopeptide repeat protein, partial [Pseudomonadota bacterium]